jgi:hypothetical protein
VQLTATPIGYSPYSNPRAQHTISAMRSRQEARHARVRAEPMARGIGWTLNTDSTLNEIWCSVNLCYFVNGVSFPVARVSPRWAQGSRYPDFNEPYTTVSLATGGLRAGPVRDVLGEAPRRCAEVVGQLACLPPVKI